MLLAISCFQDELYLYIGKIIALSILHGGPGPVFFSSVIVDYLFGGMSAVKPCVDDVPGESLQSKIKKVDLEAMVNYVVVIYCTRSNSA